PTILIIGSAALSLSCGHVFHSSCMEELYRHSWYFADGLRWADGVVVDCPLCRVPSTVL
ncbi:unnamed protein product, partial [Laminaria digitata]